MMKKRAVVVFLFAFISSSLPASLLNGQNNPLISEYCNGELCAPRVSACLLMKACECVRNGNDCSCCRDCQKCLLNLWSDCCSCVSLCSTTNNTASLEISSSVGKTPATVSSLFEILSETNSNSPVRFISRPQFAVTPKTDSDGASTESTQCKSAFYYDCYSQKNCKNSCEKMGATKYRWFHNGCCQCVGHGCTDYGETVPMCRNCYQ